MLLSSKLQPNVVIKEVKETNLIKCNAHIAFIVTYICMVPIKSWITVVHQLSFTYRGHKIFSNSSLINNNDVCILNIRTVNLCMSNFVTEHFFSGCG